LNKTENLRENTITITIIIIIIHYKTEEGTKGNKENLEGNSSGLVIRVERERDTWQ
jgi:hypothetical protein